MIYNSIDQLIGNTPLLEIDPKVHGLQNIKLYAKLELFNPFGSVKDRVAKSMLEPIIQELKAKNKTVVEASSGNTAKALTILSSINGLKINRPRSKQRGISRYTATPIGIIGKII